MLLYFHKTGSSCKNLHLVIISHFTLAICEKIAKVNYCFFTISNYMIVVINSVLRWSLRENDVVAKS